MDSSKCYGSFKNQTEARKNIIIFFTLIITKLITTCGAGTNELYIIIIILLLKRIAIYCWLFQDDFTWFDFDCVLLQDDFFKFYTDESDEAVSGEDTDDASENETFQNR